MIEFWLESAEHPPLRFRAGSVMLGRDRSCDVILGHPSVCSVHAYLFEWSGRLILTKQPQALIFLDGRPVGDRPVEVYDGDLLEIGPWCFRVLSPDLARRPCRRHPRTPESADTPPSDVTIIRAGSWDRILPRSEAGAVADDSTSTFTR